MALVVPGLFATMALPAYAFTPQTDAAGNSSLQSLKEAGAQSLSVDAGVAANAVARDGYSATTEAELAAANAAAAAAKAAADAAAKAAADAAKAAADAANAAAQRATFTKTQKSFTGPTAEDLLAAAPQPNSSLAQIYSVALKYQGVPYVYGGATPAGFDCSGFVKYVYAQFGVNMPHSSTAQGNMGTRIPVSQAVPGDLVVSAGHIGFYAGNNMILHASRAGTPLRIGPIYADNWWIVRI
ncbi:MAG: C40 family peptidase [Mycetocola sp.]